MKKEENSCQVALESSRTRHNGDLKQDNVKVKTLIKKLLKCSGGEAGDDVEVPLFIYSVFSYKASTKVQAILLGLRII